MSSKMHDFRVPFLFTMVFAFVLVFSHPGWAGVDNTPITYSTSLAYDMGDGTLHSVELLNCTDPVMSGDLEIGRQFCLCQGVSFRVAQTIVDNWKDGVFHVNDVKVRTGWNSDGPKELFVDKLGMSEGKEGSFNYAVNISPPSELSLQDAWYEITILSRKKTFMIRATDILYGVPDKAGKTLLDYRREFMAGKLNYKLKVKTLKKQAGARVKGNPFDTGSFSVKEILKP